MAALLCWSTGLERTSVALHAGGNVVTVFGKRPLTHICWIVWTQSFVSFVRGLLLVLARAKTREVLLALLGVFWLVLGVVYPVGILSQSVEMHRRWLLPHDVLGIAGGIALLVVSFHLRRFALAAEA